MGQAEVGFLRVPAVFAHPLLAVLLLGGTAFLNADPAPPLTPSPLTEVMAEANRSRKPVLVAFLGPDWSLASRKFRGRVLQSEAFRRFAGPQILYWPVLARRQPKLKKQERARLQALVIHFDIKTYPTLLVLDPDGTERLRHGYREMSGEEYVRLLKALLPPDS